MCMVCIQKRENHKPSSPTHLTLAILLLQPLSAGMTGVHHPSRLYFFAPLFTGHRTNPYFWWTFSKTQHGRSHAFGLGKALTILRGHILYLKKNLFYPLLTLLDYIVSMRTSLLLGFWVTRDTWPGRPARNRQQLANSLKQSCPSEWQLKTDAWVNPRETRKTTNWACSKVQTHSNPRQINGGVKLFELVLLSEHNNALQQILDYIIDVLLFLFSYKCACGCVSATCVQVPQEDRTGLQGFCSWSCRQLWA